MPTPPPNNRKPSRKPTQSAAAAKGAANRPASSPSKGRPSKPSANADRKGSSTKKSAGATGTGGTAGTAPAAGPTGKPRKPRPAPPAPKHPVRPKPGEVEPHKGDYIRWGHVKGPHALRGWVRLLAYAEQKGTPVFQHVWIGATPATATRFAIGEMRLFKDGVLALMKSFAGQPAVQRWEASKGQAVWIDRKELGALDDDEYYVQDLVGMTIIGPDGNKIGTLDDIEDRTGTQTTLVINRGSHRARVPFHDAYVGAVDVKAGTVQLKQDTIGE